MTRLRNSDAPQDVGSPSIDYYWFFARPQMLFSDPSPPPPPTFIFEVAEQTVGVFDDIIYDETGSGNDGQIVVTNV